jgi:hypothetical protein
MAAISLKVAVSLTANTRVLITSFTVAFLAATP